MDRVFVPQRASSQPLDPLSTSEIALAAAIARASHGAEMKLKTIVLHEPVDTAALKARRAFISFHDRNPTLDVPPAKSARSCCA
jgi:primary-amine oxidase